MTRMRIDLVSGAGLSCRVCDVDALYEATGFSSLARVTSDCFPFRPGGRLTACGACGTAQKVTDGRWFAEILEIYGKYRVYHQSGGVEQSVFDPTTAAPIRRSFVLAERLALSLGLATAGQLLDFGCGNGAMLEAFSAVRPNWSLFGFDLDDRSRERLQTIPRFSGLYTGTLETIPAGFDLITMAHSLEHLPEPAGALHALRGKLSRHGRLFVQVPNVAENPFDLVVADHLCHFTPSTLVRLLSRSGFFVEVLATDWVKKEISLVARAVDGSGDDDPHGQGGPAPSTPVEWLQARVGWLRSVVAGAEHAAQSKSFGLFGTSVSATWLFGCLGEAVEFFVDEDPARVNGRHMGRPILRPEQAPEGATIYIPLIPVIASSVRGRLWDLPLRLHVTPALPSPG